MMQLLLSRFRHVTLSLFVIGSIFILTGFSIVPAAHAQTEASVQSPARYCAVLLDRVHRGETTSRVLSSHCSNSPLVQPKNSTLLMTFFADLNYGGDSYSFYGDGGPCDASGYSLNVMPDGWNDTISSFQVFNNCLYTNLYVDGGQTGPCQRYYGNVTYVGDSINDQTSSIHVSAAPRSC